MFYTSEQNTPGVGIGLIYSLSHATSDDGLTGWTKDVNNPLVHPTSAPVWASFAAAEPGCVVANNQLLVFFAGVAGYADLYQNKASIGVISTPNGVTFSSPQLVLDPQDVFARNDSNGRNITGYSCPCAAVLGDGYVHVWTDVVASVFGKGFTQVSLHHAYSNSLSGLTNWIQDDFTFLERTTQPWMRGEINGPSVLPEGNQLKLWWGAHYFPDGSEGAPLSAYSFGVGYATVTYQTTDNQSTSSGVSVGSLLTMFVMNMILVISVLA
jgi:hypothetical protein